ncbi:hypothetical protein CPT_Pasto_006 [Rhizobium phage Pasto]|uniref:Uncharacterized protein n=1 Tax=Rhizobium phage Pasto TaxID=2767575 RepID=A0A7S6R6V6_9CAUD|nr:hypothetical protein CPT_Pasto_006 [Rhizobium phage Pasto]
MTNVLTFPAPSSDGANSVSDMTIAMEFILTAMRATVNGHPIESEDVIRPLVWARSKINEVLDIKKL